MQNRYTELSWEILIAMELSTYYKHKNVNATTECVTSNHRIEKRENNNRRVNITCCHQSLVV